MKNSCKNFALLIITIVLLACTSDETSSPEERLSPAEVAVAFFDAIYNQNDIDKALTFCTQELAEEVSQYVTAKNAARRLFNMSFDSVDINAAMGDIYVRQEFANSGKLTILFTGKRQGKIYKEIKDIRMINKDNTWLIDEFLPDPDYY